TTKLSLPFTNKTLLQQAFTHSSYVNEHQYKHLRDNERLEFLGDAVLELAVSDYLFMNYPEMAEGEMTRFRAQSYVKNPYITLLRHLLLVIMCYLVKVKRERAEENVKLYLQIYLKLF